MDNLSSSDLDSPSKTPLFIAIAAVIVALVSLWIGWMGFSQATKLEKQLADVNEQIQSGTGLDESVQANADNIERINANLSTFSKSVNEAVNEVSSDISKIKSDVRKVAIEAGTAKKMVEDLEKKGVQVSVVPAKSSASSSSSDAPAARKAPDATPGKQGVYTIKSGDTLGKIAAAYKISLSELQAANPGVDPRRLRIGQQLVIPAPSN